MAIINKFTLLLSLLLIGVASDLSVKGQNTRKTPDQDNEYREKLKIITDRDIYITGEEVWVKIHKTDGLICKPSGISKVIYLEFLDAQNNPMNQIKIKSEGFSGAAVFRLSDTLSSGNYLIRAYTSWMQNFSSDFFSYRVITVINPFKDLSDLVNPATENTSDNNLTSALTTEHDCLSGPADRPVISVSTDKNNYGIREKVKINISVTGTDRKPLQADLSVSVVKAFLSAKGQRNTVGSAAGGKFERINEGTPLHLPELEGELIRGLIFNKATNEPLRNTDISFSVVGRTARCQFARTNEDGRFTFVTRDLAGLNEIVIQPLVPDNSSSYVDLDQYFSNSYSSFSLPRFNLDTSMAENINNAVISMQVTNNYEQTRKKNNDSNGKTIPDFFGAPSRVIYLRDFIELKDIREVVKEILPDVSLFRKNGRQALKVVSSNAYQLFSDQALVLFDGVPVNDIEALMKVDAKDLDEIRITNTRYFYSEYIFDGIISFISKSGNLDFSESTNPVFRQVFEGCQKLEKFYSPDYGSDRFSKIPDLRNTLFWKPDLTIAEEGSASVEFYTSDEAMDYLLTIDGVTSDGAPIHFSAPLVVN